MKVLQHMIFPLTQKVGQTIIFVRTKETARSLHSNVNPPPPPPSLSSNPLVIPYLTPVQIHALLARVHCTGSGAMDFWGIATGADPQNRFRAVRRGRFSAGRH